MSRRLQWAGALIVLLCGMLFVAWTPDTDPGAMRTTYGAAPSQFVDLGRGLVVHLRDEGPRDAPVLVLLHGSNASLHDWDGWVDRMKTVYRVVRFDQVGHGLTGPSPTRDYSQAAFVDTVGRVAARLRLDRFALAGNSMGGGVALDYAVAQPDRVSALVLVAPSGAAYATHSTPWAFRVAQAPVLRPLVLKVTPRPLVASALRSVHADPSRADASIDRYWELLRYPGNRQAMLDLQRSSDRSPRDAQARAVRVPTLILWGDRDRILDVSGAAWFAARIRGSRTIVYPQVGHVPMIEAADRSAADTLGWLAALPAAR